MIELAPRIVVDPNIHHGKPVIAGTRVPVEIVVGQRAAGMTEDEIAYEYDITIEDSRAALQCAADVVASEIVRATG